MEQISQHQIHSSLVCKQIKPSIWSCGNATHGVAQEPASSIQRKMKKKRRKKLLLPNQNQKLELMITAMTMETATHVLVPPLVVSDVDGALVVPSVTEVSVRPHSNVEVSLPDNHITSPAQLISELLIARDTHATGKPKSAT
jgi:hypothetical protein